MNKALWLPGLVVLIPAWANAQVSVNPAALQQLRGLPPAASASALQPVTAKPPAPAHEQPAAHKHPKPHHPAKPANPAPLPLPPPSPDSPAVSQPPSPPSAKPVEHKPSAPPVARLAFAPGSSALPADATSILKPFCSPDARVPILTRVPADSTDASGSMRLAMARAFALRDALIACGVKPQNIIPRAIGGTPGADNNEALIGASAKP
ncbi:hypothetical protein [Acidocella sp.]|uniref:hypothetical protein n=1 Tax=Acidocella sp. TaxID=50710 RepID=UPI003CFC0179